MILFNVVTTTIMMMSSFTSRCTAFVNSVSLNSLVNSKSCMLKLAIQNPVSCVIGNIISWCSIRVAFIMYSIYKAPWVSKRNETSTNEQKVNYYGSASLGFGFSVFFCTWVWGFGVGVQFFASLGSLGWGLELFCMEMKRKWRGHNWYLLCRSIYCLN